MKYFFLVIFLFFSFSQKKYIFDINQLYKNKSFEKGLEHFQKYEYQKASVFFLKALSYDSKDYNVRYFLGLSFYFQGEITKAINEWNNIILLGGQDVNLIEKVNLLKEKITQQKNKITYSFDDYRYIETYPKDIIYNFKKYNFNTFLAIQKTKSNGIFFLEHSKNIFGSINSKGNIANIFFSPSLASTLSSSINISKEKLFYDFVVLDDNEFLFTDFNNNQILKYKDKKLSVLIKSDETNLIYGPQNIFLDENKNIFFSDIGRSMVHSYNKYGKYLYSFGGFGEEDNKMILVNGLLYSPSKQKIYISDKKNGRIKVFNKFGAFIKNIEHYSFVNLGNLSFYNDDEEKITAVVKNNVVVYDLVTKEHRFLLKEKNENFLPHDLFFDSQKNLYIANGNKIDIYSPDNKDLSRDKVFVEAIDTKNFPYVNLRVSIKNDSNKSIANLTSKNFIIEENNIKRKFAINPKSEISFWMTIVFANNYQTSIRSKKLKGIFDFFYQKLSVKDRIKTIQIKNGKSEMMEDFSQNRLTVINQFDEKNFFNLKQSRNIQLEQILAKEIVKKKKQFSIKRSILLIIDKPYDSTSFAYPKIKKYLYKANAYRIPIYILYIGQNFSSDYFLDLKKIVDITDGEFFFYSGSETLKKVWQKIATNRKPYSITYLSSFQNRDIGSFRKVNVKINYQGRESNDHHMGYLIPWRFKFSSQK